VNSCVQNVAAKKTVVKSASILFISHDASRTGAPIFLTSFLRWFRQNQQTPFRVLVGGSGRGSRALYADFKSLGPMDTFEPATLFFKVLRRLNATDTYRSHHLSALRKKLLNANVRLIYVNTIATGEILEFLSFLDCPVICHVHELESIIRFYGEENMGLVKKYTSVYIAASRAVKVNLMANHGIPEDRIQTVHEFIPLSETGFARTVDSRAAVLQELRLPAGSKLILNSGYIPQERKGVDLFLKVAEKVTQRYPAGDVHFVWVGGRSAFIEQMRKEVEALSLKNSVHFIGSKPDVTPYYEASDVFMLTSREDPYPLVMLEAASHGKPIVCFGNSGGAPEFVEDDAGFVVPGFDVAKMAERIIDLLSSPDLSNRMGAIARRKVFDRHDLTVVAPTIAKIIQEKLSLATRERT
jgi:glycosyltransferase involved in cell wall biosynthesis